MGWPTLHARCDRCVGLCCVLPAFARSADFAFAKPAGQACRHLRADAACGIHDRLLERGMPGCVRFDCFGAGQRLVAEAGLTVADRGVAQEAFGTLKALHEMLWYLRDAVARRLSPALRARVEEAVGTVTDAADSGPGGWDGVDVGWLRHTVGEVLAQVSAEVRTPAGPRHRGADLAGGRLAGAGLRRADLRSALLIGADLRGADLRGADLLGADLRAADLRGADLREALFLTAPQLAAARGDGTTRRPGPPGELAAPAHWG